MVIGERDFDGQQRRLARAFGPLTDYRVAKRKVEVLVRKGFSVAAILMLTLLTCSGIWVWALWNLHQIFTVELNTNRWALHREEWGKPQGRFGSPHAMRFPWT